MADSVYKVIELIGTSKDSWEKAAKVAVDRASKSLRDLRVAEVVQLDMQLDAKGRSKPIAPRSRCRSSSRAADKTTVCVPRTQRHKRVYARLRRAMAQLLRSGALQSRGP